MNELNLKTNLVYTIPSAEDLCIAILQGQNPFSLLTVEFASLVDLALNTISTDKRDFLNNDNDTNFLDKAIQKGMTTNINVAIGKAFVNLYQAHKYAGEQLHSIVMNEEQNNLTSINKPARNRCVKQLNDFAEQINEHRNILKHHFSNAYESVLVEVE